MPMTDPKEASSPRSAAGASALEARYYLSADVYRLETERIFGRRWLYAARCEALGEAGSFLLHEVEGQPLIIVQDGNGRVFAHHNVCRHRGTRLCEQPRGRFSKSIQCPYHGWTYDLRGRLIGAPNMPHSFDRDAYGLKSISVDEWEGLLFIHFGAHPPSLRKALIDVWSKFQGWRLSELRVVHEQVYEVAANWKLLFQNYSECYHCPTLHPRLNRLTPYRKAANDLEEGPVLGGPMSLSDGVQSMTTDGRRCAPILNPAWKPGLVHYYTVFPNLFLSFFPDYVLIHRLERQSPSETQIVCQWLFDPRAAAAAGFDPQPAIEFWDLTNRQDWHICELAQEGIASPSYTPGPYSDLESILAAFDREYLKALSDESE